MSATQRSWQGHLKVTARSNQLKMDENNLFLLFFLQLCPLKMSMMVQTHLKPNTEFTKHISRHYRGFIGVGRVLTPSNHPYVSPVWCDRNWQKNRQIVLFQPIVNYVPTIRVDGAQPKQIYTWQHALELGVIGVFVRSRQGHLEVKARSKQLKVVEKVLFFCFSPRYIHLGCLRWLKTTYRHQHRGTSNTYQNTTWVEGVIPHPIR